MDTSTQVKIVCISLFLVFLSIFSAIAQERPEALEKVSIPDPETLIPKDSIPFDTTTRTFQSTKFDGLRKRYQSIEGIVMIGITNEHQEVLLKGPNQWAPLGGGVKPGEDWAAAARRIAYEETGRPISISKAVLVEKMRFQLHGNPHTNFSAFILHLQASPRDNNWKQDIQNSEQLQWFNKVPKNAHPNHIPHIQLFLP